jgi:hypothetical protein
MRISKGHIVEDKSQPNNGRTQEAVQPRFYPLHFHWLIHNNRAELFACDSCHCSELESVDEAQNIGIGLTPNNGGIRTSLAVLKEMWQIERIFGAEYFFVS